MDEVTVHLPAMDESAVYRGFGAAIAARRKALGKTQDYLATAVGLSRASLANIERGKQRVFLHQILALADALQLSSAHEIIPDRMLDHAAGNAAEITMSGAEDLTNDQKMLVNSIVNTVSAAAIRKSL